MAHGKMIVCRLCGKVKWCGDQRWRTCDDCRTDSANISQKNTGASTSTPARSTLPMPVMACCGDCGTAYEATTLSRCQDCYYRYTCVTCATLHDDGRLVCKQCHIAFVFAQLREQVAGCLATIARHIDTFLATGVLSYSREAMSGKRARLAKRIERAKVRRSRAA